ncbi:hypothetical protein QTO30_18540 [Yoonia sp. GPGPB17]|uniref:hypothetical protein n=1 Tax=Yoonia sp. GPGPB17 TaxID=3026147 RepID=UPI0030C2644C
MTKETIAGVNIQERYKMHSNSDAMFDNSSLKDPASKMLLTSEVKRHPVPHVMD